MTTPRSVIIKIIDRYLKERSSGKEFIDEFEEAYLDLDREDFSKEELKVFDKIYHEIPFYVENPVYRREHILYFGDEKLKTLVSDIYKAIVKA